MILEGFPPGQLISANRRIHHHQRAQVCRFWRTLAATAAIKEKPLQRAHITIWFRFPDRRRRDVSNLYPFVVKPLIDGCVDSGLLPDDDDAHLIGPDMRRDPTPGPHRITITIEDIA